MDWEAFYAHFREPDFVPGYEIQNRLGGGAFGEVYKARKHSIGKSYAIKFLKVDDDAQKEAVERELEQVRHFAALDHANLVSIEDLGTALGVPYVIMGYAGEETLARRLKQGPLDEHTALVFFVQACRGVLALHERRLVHFDLKPSNVFLKGDVARVGDYGLSKMMADGKTTLSFGRGTPQYMAPEMLKNRADHRADVYSLGVILYECLTGKLPFEPPVAGAIALRDDDAPPRFPPDFPPRLKPVVERCLHLAPADRYASVADLLAALGESARGGEPVRASPDVPSATVTPIARGPSSSTVAGARTGASAAEKEQPSEVRQTAAELTRGAVEVARGVWDGLRPAPAARDTGETPSTPAPSVPLGRGSSARADAPDSDVVVVHTLRDSDPPPRAASMALVSDGTIPVPPAVRGGWIGTLFSTFALGLEVLLTLARGVASAAFGLVMRRSEGSGTLRFLGGFVRLALFAVLLAVVGGLSTLFAYELFAGASR